MFGGENPKVLGASPGCVESYKPKSAPKRIGWSGNGLATRRSGRELDTPVLLKPAGGTGGLPLFNQKDAAGKMQYFSKRFHANQHTMQKVSEEYVQRNGGIVWGTARQNRRYSRSPGHGRFSKCKAPVPFRLLSRVVRRRRSKTLRPTPCRLSVAY